MLWRRQVSWKVISQPQFDNISEGVAKETLNFVEIRKLLFMIPVDNRDHQSSITNYIDSIGDCGFYIRPSDLEQAIKW